MKCETHKEYRNIKKVLKKYDMFTKLLQKVKI